MVERELSDAPSPTQEDQPAARSAGQWTPGPWLVREFDALFQVQSADGIKVVSTSWHGSLRKPYPLKAEARANARLAAAAPALLEALREAQAVLAMMVEPHAIQNTTTLYAYAQAKAAEAKARAAIALATHPEGQTPFANQIGKE